jgi:nucleoside-diphosphate-sugar epimerase
MYETDSDALGMKIFVTGGTGFIGFELLKSLLGAGHQVVALHRNGHPDLANASLKWANGSLLDVAALAGAMKGCEGVYHVAALARMWHPEKDAFFTTNVTGTENVVAAAKQAGVRKLVYTSTAGVMSYSIATPIREDDPQLEPFDEDYPASKYLGEQVVRKAASDSFETVVVCPPRVYGPGTYDSVNPVNKLVAGFLKRSFYFVPGNGRYAGNFAFIEDVVRGHVLAMEKGRSGHRYTTGGENHDFVSFYQTLERLTGKKGTRLGIPRGAMSFLATGSELFSMATGRAPFVTRAMVGKIFSNRLLSCEKAVKELGYIITPLEQGLAKTIESIKRNNGVRKK